MLAHRPVSMPEPTTPRFPCLCTCAHMSLVKAVLVGPGRSEGSRMATQRGATPGGIERPFNNLLRRLSASDFALIGPHSRDEEAETKHLLYNPATGVKMRP